METAVSLPDELFERGEQAARRVGLNRSELYARALAQFIAGQGPDSVTQSWNEVAADAEARRFGAVGAAQARALVERGEWDWSSSHPTG